MGVDALGIHPSEASNSLRQRLAKVKSAAALMEGGALGHRGAGRSRSGGALEPVRSDAPRAARPRAIARKPSSKWQKALALRRSSPAPPVPSALDAAMAEMAKLCGAAAVPTGGSGVGAATRAVIDAERAAAAAAAAPETEEADRPTPAEVRYALHDQLAEKAATLRRRLDDVARLQAAVETSADPRLAERARVHQNVAQGLELMEELAREARADACERAIRLRAKKTRTLPHFISILHNDGLSGTQLDALKRADALVRKHAPEARPYRAPGYAVPEPTPIAAAPSPLGSRYRVAHHPDLA